jgi:hypothetical protein
MRALTSERYSDGSKVLVGNWTITETRRSRKSRDYRYTYAILASQNSNKGKGLNVAPVDREHEWATEGYTDELLESLGS